MNKEIGRRIKSKRLEKDMTLKELGEKIGVASSTILRYEKGEIKKIKLPVISSIADVLNVNPAWLVLKSDNPKPFETHDNRVKEIPIVGTIAAGTPVLAQQNVERYFTIDKSIKTDFALKVKGDSMINVGIYEGDIAFIKHQPILENGEIGAVLINGEATLKRIYVQNNSITLVAENAKYPPRTFTEGDIRILGKLSAVLHNFD